MDKKRSADSGALGILGGTFDPVHHGHLRLALECLERLELDEVRLIPVNLPPHREAPAATAPQRLRMLELAVEGGRGLSVDDREIRRGKVSYTVPTLESLRVEFPRRPLCLILGMDAFQVLHTWNRWTSLPDYAHIIVVDRPGNDLQLRQQEIRELYSKHAVAEAGALRQSAAGSIFKAQIPVLDISSTRIRGLTADGRDIRYLTPDKVITYIQKHGLYRDGE